ncbi:hypothetical protein AMATHDRAFT_66464 [Amanita thiersii Skay4041]|uniref:Cytochrome P450 n=1 Tax=Amanita thiersii Skay4041 TaxID=703135 RepID=A0A2A9NIA0_9AGAR|nr:hypothetical protein AMATHDRAFT_66464 [Amanita thiersii Skay4041]
MGSYDLLASAASFLLIYFLHRRSKNRGFNSLPLPPGPKGWPIIGNLLDMPPKFEWMKYHEWCKEYDSDIIYLNIAGLSVIVLDTPEATTELLERRSSIYSDRPRLPMINELMGWDFNFGFMGYGERWRSQRRLMHQIFHPTAARSFRPHSLKAAHGLLRRFLEKSDDVLGNLRHMAGETIISIAYGLHVLPENDPYIATAEAAVHPLVAAGVPGAFLVDSFPFLKHVPEWFPGAGFQRKAREWRKLALNMLEKPYKAAMAAVESGSYTPSFVSYSHSRVNEHEDLAWQELLIKSTAGTMYAAGSDTTVSAIASCVLGLLQHSDVLKRAQEEIDSVVAYGELPTFDDEENLPLITAICMETLRWRDVVPIAVPHLLTVDDIYKGYRLPKGSLIVPNGWAMLHNEEVYPEPFEFKPDRFLKDGKLNKDVKDPSHAIFGFGRRICPGRYMAFSAVWITIASLIAAFDITKAVDENGNVIDPDPEYLSGLVIMPKPYKCSIKPRSKKHEEAIKATLDQSYDWV